jgi:hypothetical protein
MKQEPTAILAALPAAGPVSVGLDETIERRCGCKLTARAIYREAARSSQACYTAPQNLGAPHPLIPVI